MKSDKEEKSVLEEFLQGNKAQAQEKILIETPTDTRSLFGKRFLALVIDKLILFIIGFAIGFLFRESTQLGWVSMLLGFFYEFLYAGYFYSTRGATPGKRLLGLQVVGLSGDQIDFFQGGMRDTLGKFLSSVILGAGYLMALVRDDHRTLHDLMFKTKVTALPKP